MALYTMHAIFRPIYTRPTVNMIHNGFDPNNNYGTQSSSHFHVPTEYQYLMVVIILIRIDVSIESLHDVRC